MLMSFLSRWSLLLLTACLAIASSRRASRRRDKGDRVHLALGTARPVPGRPTERQTRRRDLDEGLTRQRHALVVLGQPPISREPSKRTFNYPPPWLHLEAAAARL